MLTTRNFQTNAFDGHKSQSPAVEIAYIERFYNRVC